MVQSRTFYEAVDFNEYLSISLLLLLLPFDIWSDTKHFFLAFSLLNDC